MPNNANIVVLYIVPKPVTVTVVVVFIIYLYTYIGLCCYLFHTNIDMASASKVLTSSDKRVFPPLYVQTGDVSKDRLAFIHILERLKVKSRFCYLILRLIIKFYAFGLDAEKNRMG